MTPALLTPEAIEEAQPHNPAVAALRSFAERMKWDRNELTVTVAAGDIVAAATAAKTAGYNYLMDVTAVDWYPSEPRFQVSYHLLSIPMKRLMRLAVMLPGEDASVDTVTPVWPSANFYEREVFDLFGIRFAGHPNMTRIMMPTDWKGHPLRKDYPVEGYR